VGRSALDGTFAAGQIGAILFRLDPAAMDLVHTMLPIVTVLGTAVGSTDLRIEEEIRPQGSRPHSGAANRVLNQGGVLW
jgi:hypothetical protein